MSNIPDTCESNKTLARHWDVVPVSHIEVNPAVTHAATIVSRG
jgi:hypothetical protein